MGRLDGKERFRYETVAGFRRKKKGGVGKVHGDSAGFGGRAVEAYREEREKKGNGQRGGRAPRLRGWGGASSGYTPYPIGGALKPGDRL